MDIDNTVETMTTKEIATALEMPDRTVRNIAKSLFPDAMSNGKTSRFTKSQCFEIACKAGKAGKNDGQVGQVDYEKLSVTIARAVVIALRETMPGHEPKQSLLAAPEISQRDSYRRAINMASKRTGASQQELYGMVANELYYRCHVNVRVKAKNSGQQMIDIIEQEGLLPDAIAIADEM